MSVEITSAMVEALHADAALSPLMLRMQLALAITRLVNGIVDPAQKGKFAASVATLASNAGLPRILVDVRHQSTHNELPSLPTLRLAAEQSLRWLQGGYWARQRECLSACTEKIQSTLREYLALRARAAQLAAQGGRRLGAEDEEEEGAGVSEASMKAMRAEEKKRRVALLGELHGLVPPAASALMVPALLDSDLLPPPDPSSQTAEQQALKRTSEQARHSSTLVFFLGDVFFFNAETSVL